MDFVAPANPLATTKHFINDVLATLPNLLPVRKMQHLYTIITDHLMTVRETMVSFEGQHYIQV